MYLKRIEAINCFGYKELSKEFGPEDLVLIVGKNGNGKSAFFDLLTYGIHGKFPRKNVSVEEVIRRGTDSANVTLNFSDNTKIVRTRNLSSGNLVVDIPGLESETSRASDLQQLINARIGSYPIYMNSNYMMAGFLSLADSQMTPGKRIDLIRKLLNIDILSKGRVIAGKKSSDLLGQISPKKETLRSLQNTLDNMHVLSDIELSELSEKLKSIESVLLEIAQLEQCVAQGEHFLSEKNIIISNISKIDTQINELSKPFPYDELKQQADISWEKEKAKLLDRAKVLKEDVAQLTSQKVDTDFDSEITALTKQQSELSEQLQEFATIQSEKIKLSETLKDLSLKRTELSKAKLVCPKCSAGLIHTDSGLEEFSDETALQQINIQEQAILSRLEDLKQKDCTRTELQNTQAECTRKLQEISDKKLEQIRHEHSIKEKQIQLSEIDSQGRTGYVDYQNTCSKLLLDKQSAEQNKPEAVATLSSDKKELENKMVVVEAKIKEFELTEGQKRTVAKKEEVQSEKLSIRAKLETNQAAKITMANLIKEKKKLASEIPEIESEYKKASFCVEKFPIIEKKLFNTYLPEIEAATNKWLSEMSDLSMFMNMTHRGIDIKVQIGMDTWAFEQRGRGERARIAVSTTFATREASRNAQASPLDVLCVDEAVDFMDVEGIEAFCRIIKKIHGQRFVVSHNEDLISQGFDRVFRIENNFGISQMVEI